MEREREGGGGVGVRGREEKGRRKVERGREKGE